MYVCKTLSDQTADGLQTCLEWATFSDIFQSVAITKTQMIQIGGSLIGVAAVFIVFAVIASATNKL